MSHKGASKEIVGMRLRGMTYREIEELTGFSRIKINKIWKDYKRVMGLKFRKVKPKAKGKEHEKSCRNSERTCPRCNDTAIPGVDGIPAAPDEVLITEQTHDSACAHYPVQTGQSEEGGPRPIPVCEGEK